MTAWERLTPICPSCGCLLEMPGDMRTPTAEMREVECCANGYCAARVVARFWREQVAQWVPSSRFLEGV